MWNRRHRWLRRLAAGFAFAGLVVPAAAQAHHLEISGGSGSGSFVKYDGYGYRQSPGVPLDQQVADSGIRFFDGGAYVSQPQVVDSGIRFFDRGQYVAETSIRPDDRAVRITPQPVDATNVARPDDRGERLSPSDGELPQVVAEPSTGFDWSDAGIGAGMAVGLMLLALGAALATRHASRKSLAGA
jgi:hypothetical protein